MRPILTLPIIACLAVHALPVPAAAAEPRVIEKHYVGAPVTAGVTFCGNPRPVADGISRVCFLLRAGDTTVGADILDTWFTTMAGRLVFFGETTGLTEPPDVLGVTPFCDSIADAAVPPGATHFDVEIGDRVELARPCGPASVTMGTYGTVRATIA